MTAMKPITNLAEPLTQSGGNGASFEFRYRRMGAAIGLEKLSCSLYVVPPGKRAFPYHAHSLIEEMFVVLEGSGTLRHEGQEYPLRAGDVIAAPLGQAHQIVNTSDRDLRYLAVSSNLSADVVVYPDSNKILAYSEAYDEKLWHMTRRTDAIDYFDGE